MSTNRVRPTNANPKLGATWRVVPNDDENQTSAVTAISDPSGILGEDNNIKLVSNPSGASHLRVLFEGAAPTADYGEKIDALTFWVKAGAGEGNEHPLKATLRDDSGKVYATATLPADQTEGAVWVGAAYTAEEGDSLQTYNFVSGMFIDVDVAGASSYDLHAVSLEVISSPIPEACN